MSLLKRQTTPVRETPLFITGATEVNTVANVIRDSGDSSLLVSVYAVFRFVKLVSLLSVVSVKLIYMYILQRQRHNSSSSSNKKMNGEHDDDRGEDKGTALTDDDELMAYVGAQIRGVFETMGGAFIKIGQWSATRSDLFPDILCRELQLLQNKAPPHSYEETMEELRSAGVADKFVRVDKKPLACGCIGQVHRAWLLKEAAEADVDQVRTLTQQQLLMQSCKRMSNNNNNNNRNNTLDDGSSSNTNGGLASALSKSSATAGAETNFVEVVIKVQHPGIVRKMAADIVCLSWASWLAETLIPRMVYSEPVRAAEEFGALLMTQLDLRREAENLNSFRYHFRTSATVCFPRPFMSLSSRKVLVETFEAGTPLGHLQKEQVSKGGMHEGLSSIAIQTFFQMIFRDNLIHSDLHPMNLLGRFRTPVSSREEEMRYQQSADDAAAAAAAAVAVTRAMSSGTESSASTTSSSTINTICSDDGGGAATDGRQQSQHYTSSSSSREQQLKQVKEGEEDPATAPLPQLLTVEPVNVWSHSQLVILDPGLVTTLSPREMENFVSLFSCVAVGDGDLGAQLLLQWRPAESRITSEAERTAYITDMKHLFERICPASLSFSSFDISYILHEILREMRKHRVSFDMSFATLLQSVALSESVGKTLCASQNVFQEAAPFLVESLIATGHSGDLAGVIRKLVEKFLTEKSIWVFPEWAK